MGIARRLQRQSPELNATELCYPSAGETYNIGTERERSVLEVAQDIAKHFGLAEDKVVFVKDRAFNDRYVLILVCLVCFSALTTSRGLHCSQKLSLFSLVLVCGGSTGFWRIF